LLLLDGAAPAPGAEDFGAADMLEDADRARQTITADGEIIRDDLIDGLRFKDVRPVTARNGIVTELWRPEWLGPETRPGHVVHATLAAFSETNWHCHKHQNDLLFVVRGLIKIAFYDGRDASPTRERLNVFPFSHVRPTLIAIPHGVWHALKNLDGQEAAYITMNDTAFQYEAPDDYRRPPGDASLPKPF
jgi:dTDP-4-dehydrorhamnose 3,5-epimerase